MTATLHESLGTLFQELVEGPPSREAYMLNGGDVGLVRSLDTLSAEAASAVPAAGGASIAAHVDHIRYGLSLMNRWAKGEQNPWATADWTASWTRTTVNDAQWRALREALGSEVRAWLDVLRTPRDYNMQIELNGVISSIAHLAYHFGAIRQIDRSTRGPAAS